MNFDITRKSDIQKSFRVESVMGRFDIQSKKIEERFIGNIDLPEKWQIGLIVGKSGSGKSTILNELFPKAKQFIYTTSAILDDMPENQNIDTIVKTFNSVGFSSPPSWLKPYNVLSNGEKMRVDLANAIMQSGPLFVFDEFTSVVDRQVAKIGSFAVQKAIRKTDKQFVACTCHYDVEDWLLPDWIFNTDTMTFKLSQKKNRPELRFKIFKSNRSYWRMFARHHYLSGEHSNAAAVFIATINDHICGFCSVIHFPHPRIRNMKKIHRLVVLPDYQGISVGIRLLTEVAKIQIMEGFRIGITTSSPSLVFGLKKSNEWLCKSIGRKPVNNTMMTALKWTVSTNRITVTFEYKPLPTG
jgi:ABC-type lipoprotein export system ATPase subunit/GNAT superfamily N-acetyltransferase